MSTKLIPIRDKRNGISAMLPEAYLTHPQWAEHFEAVRTVKPVIKLSEPETITVPQPDADEPKAFTFKKGSK